MKYFVDKDSVVRKIWGNGDTILFIFAGASAEFALNKAVDWLYFTGRLPEDPVGRLFSTVSYARQIVFSEYETALSSIDKITGIHRIVEQQRGTEIPDWAYRDVLFMLIDYSIRAFEVMERKLSEEEKTEVFNVFWRVGTRMEIRGLPSTYSNWLLMREEHLKENLLCTDLTIDLYKQYEKHLGWFRFQLLKQAQLLVVPKRVNQLLSLGTLTLLTPVLRLYKFGRTIKIEKLLKNVVLPREYRGQIAELDINDSGRTTT